MGGWIDDNIYKVSLLYILCICILRCAHALHGHAPPPKQRSENLTTTSAKTSVRLSGKRDSFYIPNASTIVSFLYFMYLYITTTHSLVCVVETEGTVSPLSVASSSANNFKKLIFKGGQSDLQRRNVPISKTEDDGNNFRFLR